MFRLFKCDDKPVLTELSQKQIEMLMAYRIDNRNRTWPPLRRLEPMRPERIIIPPQRPNTPDNATGRLAVIDGEPGSPARKRYVAE